ncbi:hypothetical protein D1227_09975 [Henriciella mobilis]|uniref:DUF6607 family protein n=1 Tax=Henriciella mobilis TaxID=2305467 RepID=UPI000E661BFB|nr:DUF6607 family protein [Henriciella mobilis]RIJ14891.1 hypothetical protein D1231_14835 [Henriciella mobilis]RIJ21846.1 hypothetical protein D1227_09975 [Henriciella mobilis]
MPEITRSAAAITLLGVLSMTAMAQSPNPDATFEQDREAILAMAGDYKVTFDFRETVPLTEGYTLKDPKLSGGYEIVRVIEDRGDFISLQHILVVGEEGEEFPIKHWRQDWTYEPAEVLSFVGGNAWEMRPVSEADADGAWAQEVYQVDDSPRYGAVGDWTHDNHVSQWTPPAEWRPLPRRDMTTRDDYDAVLAVNRHTITPDGWVHEQTNSKLVLDEDPNVLVREIGVNTYIKDNAFPVEVGDAYWAATQDYWAGVREDWEALEAAGAPFGLTMQGEPEALYQPLLALAGEVEDGTKTVEDAIAEAGDVIAEYTTTDIGTLEERVDRTSEKQDGAY